MNQPNTPTYRLEALAADGVVLYNRDSFLKEWGHEAPPYNPSLPRKDWLDEKAVTELTNGANSDGEPIDGDAFKAYKILKVVKNANGGATGWKLVSTGNNYAFLVSINLPPRTPVNTQIDAPKLPDSVPFPIRDPLPNENITFDFSGAIQVQRTDLLPASTTGGDSAAIARIESMLRSIAAKMAV